MNELDFRRTRRFSVHVLTELPGPAMYEDAADILPEQLLGLPHVPSDLLHVGGDGSVLFAFDHNWIVVSIQKENIRTSAISEHVLTRYTRRKRAKPVCERRVRFVDI